MELYRFKLHAKWFADLVTEHTIMRFNDHV
jgi:hypothetical protein